MPIKIIQQNQMFDFEALRKLTQKSAKNRVGSIFWSFI